MNSIRMMQAEDLDTVLSWRNHPSVCHFMHTQHQISRDEHHAWFERAQTDTSKHLLIFEPESTPLGYVSFSCLPTGNVAAWGFYTAPAAAKGSGYKLCAAALNHAFGEIGLHKVYGEVLDYNQRSLALHERLGFRQEGLLRDQHFDGASYHAVHCFGLLNTEWRPR